MSKLQSRKYTLALLALVLGFILVAFPPIVFKITILTGTEFVSLVSIIFSAYFITNVLQKKVTPPADGEA